MRCEGRIWRERHYVQCSCNAKVTRDGKDYCGTHDPVRLKEKDDARNARWEKEREEQDARWKAQSLARARAELCVAACDWMTDAEVKLMATMPRVALVALLYGKL